MTHADKNKYFQKHPGQIKVADILRQNILQKAENNNMSCTVAEEIAQVSRVTLEETGIALDLLNISIVKCQLGLFGYGPQKKIVQRALEVASSLKKEIQNSLISECLPCAAAWEIAQKLNLPRMKVSAACEALQIKIKPCQLGAF
ncbi:MAG: hypothetical protein AB2L12_16055 [Smithellaceae bacterium]